jgi:tetratricopeptide (TPR) repeat protein
MATCLINACMAVVLVLFSNTHFLGADTTANPSLAASNDHQANTLLQQGRAEEATAILQQTLATQPTDAVAHQLLCRVFYSQEIADKAIHECELAASNAPDDSNAQMWLGRAYGLKDLGEYYVAAPSIIGGGLDRAETLAAAMLRLYPAQSHRLSGLIAEKKKDIATAETEFKNAVAAGKTPEAYIDLGHFYQRQNQPDKILPALQAGIDADRRRDASLVDAASILSEANLSPQLAESLLREYLSSPAKSDDAPAFKVHLQLGDLLAQHGDSAAAQREYAAALALAPNYAPARKAVTRS